MLIVINLKWTNGNGWLRWIALQWLYLDWLLLLMRFEDEMEKKWQTLLTVLNRLIGLFRVFVTSWSESIENCTGWMSKCIFGNGGNVETRWIRTSLSIWFQTFVLSMSVVHVIKWCLWLFFYRFGVFEVEMDNIALSFQLIFFL